MATLPEVSILPIPNRPGVLHLASELRTPKCALGSPPGRASTCASRRPTHPGSIRSSAGSRLARTTTTASTEGALEKCEVHVAHEIDRVRCAGELEARFGDIDVQPALRSEEH